MFILIVMWKQPLFLHTFVIQNVAPKRNCPLYHYWKDAVFKSVSSKMFRVLQFWLVGNKILGSQASSRQETSQDRVEAGAEAGDHRRPGKKGKKTLENLELNDCLLSWPKYILLKRMNSDLVLRKRRC